MLELTPSAGDGGTTAVAEYRTDIEQATVTVRETNGGPVRQVSPNLPFMMDVNGDGLPDMVQFEIMCGEPECENGLLIHFNKGAPTGDQWTFDTRRAPLPAADLLGRGADHPRSMFNITRLDTVVLDVNGDGRDDLIIPTFDQFLLWTSTGTGFEYSAFGMPNQISWANIVASDRLWTHRMTAYDADGDGQRDLGFINAPMGENWTQRLRNGAATPRLTIVDPGVGGRIEVDYKQLSDPTVYRTQQAMCSATQRCIRPRGAVVNEHRAFFTGSDTEPNAQFSYVYDEARMDRDGRGWLGFRSRVITDMLRSAPDMPTRTMLTFDNLTQDPTTGVYPFVGIVKTSESVASADPNNLYLTTIANTLQTHAATAVSVFPTVTQSLQTTNVFVNGEDPSRAQQFSNFFAYDDFANVISAATYWNVESEGVTAETEYHHQTDSHLVDEWLINLPKKRTEFVTETPDDPRTTTYDLYPAGDPHADTGLIHRVIVEPDDAQRRTDTEVQHDEFGNPENVRMSGGDLPVRETAIEFDANGMFPTSVTENGQEREVQYHPAFGREIGTRQEVVFGKPALVSLMYLDGFGRVRERTAPTGVQETTSYQQINDSEISVQVSTTGRPSAQSTLDSIGRQTASEVSGLDGAIHTRTQYDRLGRLRSESRPFKPGTAERAATIEYDNMDRVVRITHPDQGVTEVCYKRTAICRKDPSGVGSCVVKDNRGRIERAYDDPPDDVVDPLQPCSALVAAVVIDGLQDSWVPTQYVYDPWGGLAQTIDPEGNRTTYFNDRYGHPESIDDPDLGVHGYVYNQYGQVASHTDPEGRRLELKYDAFGRLRERRYRDAGPGGSDHVTTWEYDVSGNGLLEFSKSPDAQLDYKYDDLARQELVTLSIEGETRAPSLAYDYDPLARLKTITFPTSTSGSLVIEHEYTTNGILKKVFESGRAASPFWEAISTADDGQLRESKYGNLTRTEGFDAMGRVESVQVSAPSQPNPLDLRYAYNPNGSVREREDRRGSVLENFTYDQLGRLQDHFSNSSLLQRLTYTRSGNIDTVETPAGTSQYTYDGPQAHGVARIVAGSNETQLLYDGVGNLTERSGTLTAPLNAQWEPFNKPSRIFSAADESDAVDFLYNASTQRVRKETAAEVTTYLADLYYEVLDKASGERVHHYSIQADGKVVAEVVRRDDGSATDDHVLFLHADALGSVRKATDAGGAELQSSGFAPFGAAVDASIDPSTPGTHRGFTGQEGDAFGLVNLGGRIYDPTIARFLSPDPLVPVTYSSQALNRYSYALNDPLRFTDTGGFQPCDELSGMCEEPIEIAWPMSREDAADQGIQRTGEVLKAAGAFDPNLRGPRSTFNSLSELLDTPLGTGGKVAVVTTGAAAGAAVGAGVGYGMAYATTLACGPAAGICAGVLTVGLAGYGLYSLSTGGWDTLKASFSHVFSSDTATVAESLTVGSTIGAGALGLAQAGALGPAAALRARTPITAGTRAGQAARSRILDVPEETATVAQEAVQAETASSAPPKALPGPSSTGFHHIFPRQFEKWFASKGLNIDEFTIELARTTHLKGVHGRGLGKMPGRWNPRWAAFKAANPQATRTEIYQFAGKLLDEFGLNDLPIVPYPY